MTDDQILTNLARAQGKALGDVYLWADRQPRFAHHDSLNFRRWQRSNASMLGFLHDLLVMEKAIKNGFKF